MKVHVKIADTLRSVELRREGDTWLAAIEGVPGEAGVIEVAPNTYSVLLSAEVFEVRVAPQSGGVLALQAGTHEFTGEIADPRAWSGRRHGALEAEGRQQVFAPMPGKVIRVLVEAGAAVEAGQGLLVVEAMKMQNEIRSPKSGVVGQVLVKEGATVNAGEPLAWVE